MIFLFVETVNSWVQQAIGLIFAGRDAQMRFVSLNRDRSAWSTRVSSTILWVIWINIEANLVLAMGIFTLVTCLGNLVYTAQCCRYSVTKVDERQCSIVTWELGTSSSFSSCILSCMECTERTSKLPKHENEKPIYYDLHLALFIYMYN